MNELILSNTPSATKISYDILVLDKKLAELSKSFDLSFDYIDSPDADIDSSKIEAAEFDKSIEESRKLYYLLAVSSGILTGTISGINLEKYTDKSIPILNDIKSAVVFVAKTVGMKISADAEPNDAFSSAINYIRNKFDSPASADSDFYEFAIQPSLLGLVFSFISSLTGKKIGTINGQLKMYDNDVPDLQNFKKSDKIFYAFVSWILNLAVAISKDDAGEIADGIPKAIFDFAKSLSLTSVIKEVNSKNNLSTIPLALSLVKIVINNSENDEWQIQLKTQSIPVVINECIVRASYMLLKLVREINTKGIKHVKDINKIDPSTIIPVGNRLVLRMLTISSGVFVLCSTAAVSIRSIIEAKGDFGTFSAKFILNLNYSGIARFVLAVKDDKDYIAEDFDTLIAEMRKRMVAYDVEYARVSEAFRTLELSDEQARLSYSLQWQRTYYDIQNTSNIKLQANKREWLDKWSETIVNRFGFSDGLITSGDELYKCIQSSLKNNKDDAWLHLAAIDLTDFALYSKLSDDNEIGKLKEKSATSYVNDVFCISQSAVGKKQLKDIQSSRNYYETKLNGTILKAAVGTAVVAVATAATAGAAAAFAPQIAVALVGQSFATLSGAALTNASLAFVGGGALAAGGLGMAGGVAIITGGGAVLGVICSGTASAAAIGFLSSKKNLINECSKLLAYCRVVLLDYYHNSKAVKQIRDVLACDIADMEDAIIDNIRKMESDTAEVSKEEIKNNTDSKDNLKYVRKTIEELDKLLNQEPADAPYSSDENHTQSSATGLFDNCKTIEAVEKQYKKLAQIYHPDLNPDDDGTMMQKINRQKELKIAELSSK